MKKTVAVVLVILLLVGCFGCGNTPETESDRLSVVTTIFPEYDWVMQILGDKAADTAVTMLLDNGVDLHSFQPTADDIIRISGCDLFIYVGGESDEWVDDALQEATNEDMVVIDLLDVLGDTAKAEEMKEGMETEEHDHGEETEYDEHVWLSLKNAAVFVQTICDALCGIDADNADVYSANASAYIEKINALDSEYRTAMDAAPVRTVLFADRFPFRYLTDDYGLDYYAAFAGCSAESEASFETVAFLADRADALGLSAILTLEGNDQRIAEAVRSAMKNGNVRILSVDSMQATTSKDVKNGAAYLSVMEKNLEILTDALR